MEAQLDLVIPLYNEGQNVTALLQRLADSGLRAEGLRRVLLIDNGSQDDTRERIADFGDAGGWFQPIRLPQNLGYGGGVHHGLLRTAAEFVGYMPGDNQISVEDLRNVWRLARAAAKGGSEPRTLYKGRRTVRHDSRTSRLVSRCYTLLANTLLELRVKDLNGLPKIFPRTLLSELPSTPYSTFTFDAQLLAVARRAGYGVEETPVTFHSRRAGVSSWSGKRLKTYWTTAKQIAALRTAMRTPRPATAHDASLRPDPLHTAA